MAKRYDPIMCMMVDEPAKAQDESYIVRGRKYKVVKRDGDNVTVLGPDGKVTKMDIDFLMSEGKKVSDSAKAKDESEKYAVTMKNSSGKEQYAQGWDLGSIRNWIKDNEKRGYRVTWKNFDSKTIDKAKDSKAIDKLAKVPDSKLKDFEANLRSAGFKVVSKSDRGMSTHYQVEVSSGKTFTEADLREWANKIDSVCDKMDSVAPTTWNIGLTADGKITAGLDVREMYVKDSASALDKAISTCDAASGDAMKQIASAK